MSKSLRQKQEEQRRERIGADQAYMEDFRKRGFSFLPTTDDWYPNFPGNLVAVGLVGRKTEFAVYVTGADDFAMEYNTKDKR